MGTEAFRDYGPAHEFGDCEGSEELVFVGDEGITRVSVNSVEEVGLFVVMGSEEDVVDYSL